MTNEDMKLFVKYKYSTSWFAFVAFGYVLYEILHGIAT